MYIFNLISDFIKMSGVGDLIGRHWHEWPCIGDIENTTPSSGGSLQSSCDVSPSSSRMSTPPPRCTNLDNVMKLPKRDMHVFGHCPAQAKKDLRIFSAFNYFMEFI